MAPLRIQDLVQQLKLAMVGTHCGYTIITFRVRKLYLTADIPADMSIIILLY